MFDTLASSNTVRLSPSKNFFTFYNRLIHNCITFFMWWMSCCSTAHGAVFVDLCFLISIPVFLLKRAAPVWRKKQQGSVQSLTKPWKKASFDILSSFWQYLWCLFFFSGSLWQCDSHWRKHSHPRIYRQTKPRTVPEDTAGLFHCMNLFIICL